MKTAQKCYKRKRDCLRTFNLQAAIVRAGVYISRQSQVAGKLQRVILAYTRLVKK